MRSADKDKPGAIADAPRMAPDGESVAFTLAVGETRGLFNIYLGIGAFVIALAFFFAWRDGTGFPWAEVFSAVLVLSVPVGTIQWLNWRAERDRSVYLVISRQGVLAPKTVDGLIPWDALEKIAYHDYHRKGTRWNVLLALSPYDPDRFKVTFGKASKELGQFLQGDDILLPLEALVGTPDDVKRTVSRFAPADLLERSGLPKT